MKISLNNKKPALWSRILSTTYDDKPAAREENHLPKTRHQDQGTAFS